MKRTLFFVLAFMLAMASWVNAIEITLMTNGVTGWLPQEDFRGYEGIREKLMAEYMKTHPDVKITILYRDVAQGSMTVDALMAAGTPPDIWMDAAAYHRKYFNDDYALRLEDYVDLSKYHEYLLKPYNVNGHQYAIPYANVMGAFAVNTTMLADVGYKLPEVDKWTTDEFMALGAKLKANKIPLSMVMFKGGMNDWTEYFLKAFGSQMFDYAKGDYSRVTINSPQTVAGFDYLRKFLDAGYAYPNPVEQDANNGVELFTTGKVASCMMQDGHVAYWVPQQIATGKLKSQFVVRFVTFPHAPGVPPVKIYGYQSILLTHKSKDEAKNKIIGELVVILTGREHTWYNSGVACGFSCLKDYEPSIGWAATDIHKDIALLGQKIGLQPTGDPGTKGAEIGRIWNTMTEQWIRGKIATKPMLVEFEKQANAILQK